MNIFAKAAGILGMNARNLLYIARFNSTEAKRFADDKLFTKNFLESRGIGVARLYRAIRTDRELAALDPATLPPSFVMKPNRGYGGEGIIVIASRRGNRFVGVSGREYTWGDLSAQADDILEGRYAISGVRDTILFEERLEPHASFTPILETGLPDVRVIVFNLVPVIAMLRLPTHASEGKANLHLGAVGVGIDIATGRTTYAVRDGAFTRRLPGGVAAAGFQLPFWDEVLATASRIQKLTNIGYLAVDLALTKTGLKVLEVNARAGLSVQIANRVPLRARLEKIADLRVPSVERGVDIAKTLFGAPKPMTKLTAAKPVIGLVERVTLLTGGGEVPLLAKIDPHAADNFVDVSVPLPSDSIATLIIGGRRVIAPFRSTEISGEHRLILSGRAVADFLLDPTLAPPTAAPRTTPTKRDEALLLALDKKLCAIDAQIKLLARVRPDNLAEARITFLRQPSVSPHFVYRTPSIDLAALTAELAELPRDLTHPLMPLFAEKIAEVEKKIALVAAVGSSEFAACAAALFGTVSIAEQRHAEQCLQTEPCPPDESAQLSVDAVVARFRAFLTTHRLADWRVKIVEQATTRVQVDKTHTIFVARDATFTENQLAALLAHEIETHVYRTENGKCQPYGLFARGTAGYLFTEEGLAMWNQRRLGLPLGEKLRVPALAVVVIYAAQRGSFAAVFALLREKYGLDEEAAWRLCVKVKRGMADTSQSGAFSKNRVYFVGYRAVERFLAAEKTRVDRLQQLYAGKLTIADLARIPKGTLVAPAWVPTV